MPHVLIEGLAAIRDLEIDIPDNSGGVLVLKGRNRAGKTTAIEIIRALLAGKSYSGKLHVRDGEAKGTAEGFGRTISVGQKTTYRGDLEVDSIEGKFDFSDLVEPPEKEAPTRDKTRIKALLSLTGAKPDASLFYDLLPGKQEEFEKIVPVEDIKKSTDLVELAARVARAIHAEAKRRESEAEHVAGHAAACKEAAGDCDPDNPPDMDALHSALSQASAEHSALVEKADAAKRNAESIELAQMKLEKAEREYDGPDPNQARHELSESEAMHKEAEDAVAELQMKLITAEKHRAAAKVHLSEARSRLSAAEAHETLVAELKDRLANAGGGDDAPSEVQIMLAKKAVEAAKAELEEAVVIRDKVTKAAEAKLYTKQARQLQKVAESYRAAAKSADTILSTQLPEGPLRAEAGRLVLDTDRGEGVPFDECSKGEKYRVALPYGIQSVGKGGYLALIQDGWQDLDQDNRAYIAETCKQAKVWLITGEVAEGDLRAEKFKA